MEARALIEVEVVHEIVSRVSLLFGCLGTEYWCILVHRASIWCDRARRSGAHVMSQHCPATPHPRAIERRPASSWASHLAFPDTPVTPCLTTSSGSTPTSILPQPSFTSYERLATHVDASGLVSHPLRIDCPGPILKQMHETLLAHHGKFQAQSEQFDAFVLSTSRRLDEIFEAVVELRAEAQEGRDEVSRILGFNRDLTTQVGIPMLREDSEGSYITAPEVLDEVRFEDWLG